MIHLDLFSGIGGFSLAARWVGGFETIAFCDNEEFTWKILAKNFPGIPIFKDIRELHPTDLIPRDGIIHLITAGFPCQDLSVAGKGRGIEADRSGLFFEITRLSDEIYAYCGVRPCLLLENVPNLLAGDGGAWARRVHGELASRGYHCEWKVISAADVGAPHLRRRWWCIAYGQAQMADTEGNGNYRGIGIMEETDGQKEEERGKYNWNEFINGSEAVADTEGIGLRRRPRSERGTEKQIFQQEEQGRPPLGGEIDGRSELCGEVADTGNRRPERRSRSTEEIEGEYNDRGRKKDEWWLTEPDVGRVADGIPFRVDRLKGLGNSVVPQVAMIPLMRVKEILTGEMYVERKTGN